MSSFTSQKLVVLLFLFIFGSLITRINSASIHPPDEACHPTPKSLDQVYIVGYGSLLNTPSKNSTSPNTGSNIPVNVKGLARKWNCKGSPVGHSTTFLGVDEDPTKSSFFNGVVFKLPSLQSLWDFDKREIYYCRREVNVSEIEFLINRTFSSQVEKDFPPDGAQFWIYTVKPQFFGWPNERYPIVQSYVDVFLAGCIEMEETYNLTNYKDECISTTQGWEHNWVNDRVLPRRPYVHTPKAEKIDTLIQNHFPDHFDKVLIEQEIRYNFNPNATSLARNSSTERLTLNYFLGVVALVFSMKLC